MRHATVYIKKTALHICVAWIHRQCLCFAEATISHGSSRGLKGVAGILNSHNKEHQEKIRRHHFLLKIPNIAFLSFRGG